MKNDNKYFIIQPSCLWIKGYSQSTIYDPQKGHIKTIPNDLYLFGKINDRKKAKGIFSQYSSTEKKIIDEYFDYLITNEYGYMGSEHDARHIASQSWIWQNPAIITNVIFELSKENLKFLQSNSFISQIIKLNIENFQIICYQNIDFFIPFIEEIAFKFSKDTLLNSLELILPFSDNLIFKTTMDRLIKQSILLNLFIHSSPIDEKKIQYGTSIIFTKEVLANSFSCGIVNQAYFSLRTEFLNESQAHNTCLNRKLCMDTEGNIKNCPAMQQSFGNIKDTSLQEAIEKPGFKDLWFIHKDQIDVCKDCEFRHACTDCRCFIKDPENIYSQPAKCTYNPYICKWQGEEGYIPVEECGTYNKATGFIPDKEKIEQLNKQIWEE